jgi:glycosyltransferase involved in cell wall biosynthesis
MLKRCKKGSLLASDMAALEAYMHRLMRVRERVDAFLCPSAFLRNKLIERGFPTDKVHHLPLFLLPEMFSDYSRDQGEYLLFLGKLEPIKGIRPLLDACRSAPQVQLILAGRVEGPFADELPVLLPSNARYVGMKQGEELRQLLQNSLAIILPSLWYENQPFSILEAFAYGKPVIASDLGGMTELVTHHERGLLVPPGDVNSLTEAMIDMMEHPVEAQRMGQNAYEYVKVVHQADHHYAELTKIYDKVRRG